MQSMRKVELILSSHDKDKNGAYVHKSALYCLHNQIFSRKLFLKPCCTAYLVYSGWYGYVSAKYKVFLCIITTKKELPVLIPNMAYGEVKGETTKQHGSYIWSSSSLSTGLPLWWYARQETN